MDNFMPSFVRHLFWTFLCTFEVMLKNASTKLSFFPSKNIAKDPLGSCQLFGPKLQWKNLEFLKSLSKMNVVGGFDNIVDDFLDDPVM